ncbi:MAG TPA: hypothetical protein VM223_15815 [Planctomycetota bacterium]|nr:hypothetical protein [Planctomycetota bacterium]
MRGEDTTDASVSVRYPPQDDFGDGEFTAVLDAQALAGGIAYAITQTPAEPVLWSETAPTNYIITGEPGAIILYAWAKAGGEVANRTASIHYNPNDPVISDVNIFAVSDTAALVTWNTELAAFGRVRFQPEGGVPVATAWEPAVTMSHSHRLTGLALGTTYTVIVDSNEAASELTYAHASPTNEISKTGMIATAGASGGTPQNGIDGNTGTYWQVDRRETWYRVDMLSRYRIEWFGYIPRYGNHSFKDYWVYITDSTSENRNDWGTAAVTGTFPMTEGRKDVAASGEGRYFIIYGNYYEYGPTVAELYFYGVEVPTIGVSSFSVADQSTGSMLVTNDPTVDVTMTVEGEGITGYMITESAVAPAADGLGWLADIPATYVITGGLGQKALYAWATDGINVSEGKATSILFSTATPEVSNVVVTDNGNDTATATWNTDIPAQGGMNYGEVKMSGVTPNSAIENAVGLSHSVTFATAAGVNYKIVLVNNEVASAGFYWPKPWPIDGDANMDCRVNILDLIFIRNKLNQPVGTGDNWKGLAHGCSSLLAGFAFYPFRQVGGTG